MFFGLLYRSAQLPQLSAEQFWQVRRFYNNNKSMRSKSEWTWSAYLLAHFGCADLTLAANYNNNKHCTRYSITFTSLKNMKWKKFRWYLQKSAKGFYMASIAYQNRERLNKLQACTKIQLRKMLLNKGISKNDPLFRGRRISRFIEWTWALTANNV